MKEICNLTKRLRTEEVDLRAAKPEEMLTPVTKAGNNCEITHNSGRVAAGYLVSGIDGTLPQALRMES